MKNKFQKGLPWKSLYQADKTIKVPFFISLTDHDEPILCKEVIRIIPGKRLVAFGVWDNQEVAIKLFYKKRTAKRDFQRDVFGVEALMHANVPTPKLLFKGTSDKNRIYALIYEKITDSHSIETLWREKNSIEELKPLLQAAVIEIATQHVLGILQHDLHLKNFLVNEKGIYTLDGGKISKFDLPLEKKLSMEYLALFLVQLGAGVTELQYELFDVYTQSRGWLIKPADIQYFQKMMAQNNKIRSQRYHKKIFRNCSAFKKIKKLNKLIMYDRAYESKEFIQFLKNPEKIIKQASTQLLKKGRSSTVARVTVDNRVLVVKRYNIKNSWHWLRRCFRGTRAKKSWRVGQYMYEWGIATAKPIAFIEHQVFGLRGKSYFIMENVDGCHAGHYFSQYNDNLQQYEQMAKNLLALFYSLAELRLTHGDLKMTNILIEKNMPVLIDLDGVEEHQSLFGLRYSFNLEIKRFMKNWENNSEIYALFERVVKQNTRLIL